jgi:hypothetical protein
VAQRCPRQGSPAAIYFFKYVALASFLTNLVNKNLVEHDNDGSKLTITLILKIVKFVTRFFSNIENHIMESSVPDSGPNFTPRDANPKIIQAAAAIAPVGGVAALKAKSDASPPGTPASECNSKKQKSSKSLKTKTLPRLVFFAARKERQFRNCFPAI